jgi:hypothetical protein
VNDELVERLLRYFRQHPRARDTAEGIARFWLDADVRDVEVALEHLCREGEVREVGVVGARHYEWCRRPASTGIPVMRMDGGEEKKR